MPKALPGFSGGQMAGRSDVEDGRDGEEEVEEGEQKNMDNEVDERDLTWCARGNRC